METLQDTFQKGQFQRQLFYNTSWVKSDEAVDDNVSRDIYEYNRLDCLFDN